MSNPSIAADKTPWYQWDTGLTVTVSGGEMNECHFANRKQGTAYVQAVINGVARVPDELLQVAAPIKAYGYVSDGAGGQTYIEETFEVIARNIPADYTYTKTEQKTIRDAEAARDEAVQAANDAKASEMAAADSAVEASTSAQSAGESASAAATSASNAAKSAGDAAKSAIDAKAAADRAVEDASELLKTYTDNAKTSADNAAASASNAADAANAASGSATAASTSASEAATSAREAKDAAGNAASDVLEATKENADAAAKSATDAATAKAGSETAASNAESSATAAAKSATAAAKSASDAAASVNAINVIAPNSVPAGASVGGSGFSSVAIGNSAECKAGSSYAVAVGQSAIAKKIGSIMIGSGATELDDSIGRNICIGDSTKINGKVENSVAIGSGSIANKQLEFSVGNYTRTREITHVSDPTEPTSASTKKYSDDNDANTLAESKKYANANTSNALVGTVSGKLLHVEDAWPSPVRELVVFGKSVQDGTPTPDAPVPIESVSELSVVSKGKNLLDYQSWKEYAKNKGIVHGTCDSGDDGTFTITATEGDAYTPYDVEQFPYISVGHGQEYTLSWGADSNKRGQIYVFFNGVSGNNVLQDNSTSKKLTFTTPSDCSFITFRFGVLNAGDSIKYSNIQLEPGSTATDYSPYVSSTTSNLLVSDDGTAYELRSLPDGTRDELFVKDGRKVLVKRVGSVVLDGTEEWNGQLVDVSGNIVFYTQKNDLYRMRDYRQCIMCDCLKTAVNLYDSSESRFVSGYPSNTTYPGQNWVYIFEQEINTVDGIKAFLADHTPTVNYRLATSEIIDLGPSEPIALSETVSNVWVNDNLTPEMSMTYKQDVNVVIAGLTAQIAALKGTNDIVHDDSTASPDDAIDVPDNSETLDVAGTVGEV